MSKEGIFNSMCCNICAEVVCDKGCKNMYKRANNLEQIKQENERLKETIFILNKDYIKRKDKYKKKIEALTKEKQDLISIISNRNIELINVEKENEELREKLTESIKG